MGTALSPIQPYPYVLLHRHHPRSALHLALPDSTHRSRNHRREIFESQPSAILESSPQPSITCQQNLSRCPDRWAGDGRPGSSPHQDSQGTFDSLLPPVTGSDPYVYPRDCASIPYASRRWPSTFHFRRPYHGCSGAIYEGAGRQNLWLELSQSCAFDCACNHEWSQDRGRNKRGNRCKEGQQVSCSRRDYGCICNDRALCGSGIFRSPFECIEEYKGGPLTMLDYSGACEGVIKDAASWVPPLVPWKQALSCVVSFGNYLRKEFQLPRWPTLERRQNIKQAIEKGPWCPSRYSCVVLCSD